MCVSVLFGGNGVKTLAAVLVVKNHVELQELEIPPLRQGQVLVQISHASVCGTVLGQIKGERGPDAHLPHLIGHEGSGVVLETGPGVSRVTVDDQVVLSWIAASSGLGTGGMAYLNANGSKVNSGPVATLATHAVVSENRLTKLPPNVPMDVGTLLGCCAPTGFGAVLNVAKVKPGERVAVWGAGGVGLMAVAAADYSGAAAIMAIDVNAKRLATATLLGATSVSHPTIAGKATGCDVAIVTTGNVSAMETAVMSVRPRGGRVVLVGNAPHGQCLTLDPAEFNAGKSLLGTWGGDSEPDRDNRLYARIIALTGSARVLSAPYKLEDIQAALADFESGIICRPLISMAGNH